MGKILSFENRKNEDEAGKADDIKIMSDCMSKLHKCYRAKLLDYLEMCMGLQEKLEQIGFKEWEELYKYEIMEISEDPLKKYREMGIY